MTVKRIAVPTIALLYDNVVINYHNELVTAFGGDISLNDIKVPYVVVMNTNVTLTNSEIGCGTMSYCTIKEHMSIIRNVSMYNCKFVGYYGETRFIDCVLIDTELPKGVVTEGCVIKKTRNV